MKENQVGLTPDSIPSLKKLGFDVFIETNAGLASSFTDFDYKKSGAKISTKVADLYKNAHIVVKFNVHKKPKELVI